MEKSNQETTITTIAKINNIAILVLNEETKPVPVKPICEALGIASDSQFTKIKNDEFLNSVAMLSIATGADGKQYEMMCLPYEFIFGWLFTINPNNVKEESRESVKAYKMECYKVLYKHFANKSNFLEHKQALMDEQMDKVNQIQADFTSTKKRLAAAKKSLERVRTLNFEDWIGTTEICNNICK
jgi:hypothetical protein